MKVTELKDWNLLTSEEQARLRDVYQVGADDELPETLTKTMAQPAPVNSDIQESPTTEGKTTIITPKEGSTVTVNAESVTVHEKDAGVEGAVSE